MQAFEVGQMVRNSEGMVGRIYAIRPGLATGKFVHSVKFERNGKNPSHGFYYAEDIELVD